MKNKNKDIKSVEDEFKELKEVFCINELLSDETTLFIENTKGKTKTKVSIEKYMMDFSIGKIICDIKIEMPDLKTNMRVKEIRSTSIMINFIGIKEISSGESEMIRIYPVHK